jgi:hypothetical protein
MPRTTDAPTDADLDLMIDCARVSWGRVEDHYPASLDGCSYAAAVGEAQDAPPEGPRPRGEEGRGEVTRGAESTARLPPEGVASYAAPDLSPPDRPGTRPAW